MTPIQRVRAWAESGSGRKVQIRPNAPQGTYIINVSSGGTIVFEATSGDWMPMDEAASKVIELLEINGEEVPTE